MHIYIYIYVFMYVYVYTHSLTTRAPACRCTQILRDHRHILTLSRTHLHTYSYSLSPSVPTLSLSFLSLSLSNKQTNTRTHTHTQPYHRGDGVSTQRTFAAPPPYFTEGKDQVRALINRIKLPGGGRGAPDHVRNGNARNKNAAEAPRRSADGAVKMGGGFCYKSNIDIDYTRPTPSRPTYSHGLFLFPFSNENATKMLDVAKEYSHELDPSHSASHPALRPYARGNVSSSQSHRRISKGLPAIIHTHTHTHTRTRAQTHTHTHTHTHTRTPTPLEDAAGLSWWDIPPEQRQNVAHFDLSLSHAAPR